MDEKVFEMYRTRFVENLGNDLNTSLALTVLYDALKENTTGNTKIKIVEDFDRVLSLGLIAEEVQHSDELKEYVEKLIAERAEAKKNKNYARADEIRNELAAKGIVLKDTKDGTTWQKA